MIIEDHALFRDGLNGLLNQYFEGIQLVEVSSIEKALLLEIAPYIVLLDIKLNGMSGIEGIKPLLAQWPHTKIMMMSDASQALNVEVALQQGAIGFIDKSKSSQVMLESLLELSNGILLSKNLGFDDELSEDLSTPSADPNTDSLVLSALTERQRQILAMLNLGLSNKIIGQKLHLSEHTVRWYVQKIMCLLKASSRSEAAFKARQMGFVG